MESMAESEQRVLALSKRLEERGKLGQQYFEKVKNLKKRSSKQT